MSTFLLTKLINCSFFRSQDEIVLRSNIHMCGRTILVFVFCYHRYPALARRDIHSTTCYLPVPAAQLLHHNPQLISQATRAFYLRDPIDLKSCQNMKHFSPDNRVMCKVCWPEFSSWTSHTLGYFCVRVGNLLKLLSFGMPYNSTVECTK